jgi:hypothetical protein
MVDAFMLTNYGRLLVSEDLYKERTERQLRWQDTTDGIRAQHRICTRIVQDGCYTYAAKHFPAENEAQAAVVLTPTEYWEITLAVAELELEKAKRADA